MVKRTMETNLSAPLKGSSAICTSIVFDLQYSSIEMESFSNINLFIIHYILGNWRILDNVFWHHYTAALAMIVS